MRESYSVKLYLKSGCNACLSTIGIWMYFHLRNVQSEHNSVSILLAAVFAAAVFLYLHTYSFYGDFSAFRKMAAFYSLVFSLFLAWGCYLDLDLNLNRTYFVIMLVCLSFVFFPIVLLAVNWLNKKSLDRSGDTLLTERLCFTGIILVWGLGYLAMFPGVYAVDAHRWYRAFSQNTVPVTDQWSPVYSGLFYLFVEAGKKRFNSYEAGLALFSALQMLFILAVIRLVLSFIGKRTNTAGVILTSVFYCLPVHTIIACQTVQVAPFMACFTLLLMHLVKMYEAPVQYWTWRNAVTFGFWCLCCCVLRNNAFIMLVGFVFFTGLYHKGYRRYLILTVCSVLVVASIYKGPVLKEFGVKKSDSLKEMLSMPLQQMACVYNHAPDRLTEEQKRNLREYVSAEDLEVYLVNPSISDALKKGLDSERIHKNLKDFIRLYVGIGLKAPVLYMHAAYMQDLGLLYIDKEYPDPRMWHPYLNYASYNLHNYKFITIKQESLFPAYNKLLGTLFGYEPNGYGGYVETAFTRIPVLGWLCRVALYFWILVLLLFYGIQNKKKGLLLVLSICVMFTLTILLSPVIVYRYYAPIVFGIPIIVCFAKTN